MLWGPLFLPTLLQTFLQVAQADLPFELCVCWLAASSFQPPWASGDMVSLLVQPDQLRTQSHVRLTGNPNLESDGRDQI